MIHLVIASPCEAQRLTSQLSKRVAVGRLYRPIFAVGAGPVGLRVANSVSRKEARFDVSPVVPRLYVGVCRDENRSVARIAGARSAPKI